MKNKELIKDLWNKYNDPKKVWSKLKAMEIKKLLETGSIKWNEVIEVSNKMDELLKIEMMLNFKVKDENKK